MIVNLSGKTFADLWGQYVLEDEKASASVPDMNRNAPQESKREAQASASAHVALAPGCDEALVAELVGWGFEEPAVRTALEAAGGDKQAAANMLLG